MKKIVFTILLFVIASPFILYELLIFFDKPITVDLRRYPSFENYISENLYYALTEKNWHNCTIVKIDTCKHLSFIDTVPSENKIFYRYPFEVRVPNQFSSNEKINFKVINETIHDFSVSLYSDKSKMDTDWQVDTVINIYRCASSGFCSFRSVEYTFWHPPLQEDEYLLRFQMSNNQHFDLKFEVVKAQPFEWNMENDMFFDVDSVHYSIVNLAPHKSFLFFGRPDYIQVNSFISVKKSSKWSVYRVLNFESECGTGIYEDYIQPNKKLNLFTRNHFYNRLRGRYNYLTKKNLNIIDLNSDEIKSLYFDLFGDSVKVYFKIYVNNLLWNWYPSQTIDSPTIDIDCHKMYDIWLRRNHCKI